MSRPGTSIIPEFLTRRNHRGLHPVSLAVLQQAQELAREVEAQGDQTTAQAMIQETAHLAGGVADG